MVPPTAPVEIACFNSISAVVCNTPTVVCNTAPASSRISRVSRVKIAGAVPKLSSRSIDKLPPLTVIPPVSKFAPVCDSVSVPVPFLVRTPLPTKTELMVLLLPLVFRPPPFAPKTNECSSAKSLKSRGVSSFKSPPFNITAVPPETKF